MERLKASINDMIELSIEGIFIEDLEGNILLCNTAGADMFGYTKGELVGMNIKALVADANADYLKKVYTNEDLFADRYKDRMNIKKDGTIFPTQINSKIISLEGENYLVAFVRDITEEIAIKERLYKYSFYDELTGLMNRRAIFNYIKELEETYIIGILDLDDFKQINDVYGHSVGDRFLQEFAQLIKDETRIEAGRIGGEEFVIIIKNLPILKAYELVMKVLESANDTLTEYGGIRFSVGLIKGKKRDIQKNIHEADRLLYKAKEQGKNRICFSE